MAKVIWVEDAVCWPHFRKPEVLQLFVYLLDKVDENGSVTTTYSQICKELGMSTQTLRTCLKKLSLTQQVTQQVTHRDTHITICDIASYKAEKNQGNTVANIVTNTVKETNKENLSPTPPIKENKKENISSTTTACAHEGFIEELKTDRTWGEVIAMRYSLGSLAELDDWINKFSLDVVCRDTRHKNLQDAKRHFCDWLRINLREQNNGQKHNSTSKAEHIASERERIMREVASAAPRECDAPSWLD